MMRIFLLLNLSVLSAFVSSDVMATDKAIGFDYLIQTWICKSDDDSIDSCANNPGTGRKPSSLTLTDLGDGIWAGSTVITENVQGLTLTVNIDAIENLPANETFEMFIKFKDDVNTRPVMGTMSINGINHWNSLFSLFNKSFQKGNFYYLPEVRIMAKGHTFHNNLRFKRPVSN